MGSLAVFAYDFPHGKTHDFLLEIKASGISDVVVFSAPKVKLKCSDNNKYYSNFFARVEPINTLELCESLKFKYIKTSHADLDVIKDAVEKYKINIGLISGARIIKKEIIEIFAEGIINFHPGKIPETSGLDAFYYTILNKVPLGVTTHFIDHKVDAGRIIMFDELDIEHGMSPDHLIHNNYQLQLKALRRVLNSYKKNHKLKSENIVRERKNKPLTPDEKYKIMPLFDSWFSLIKNRQDKKKLINSVESRDLKYSRNFSLICWELFDVHPLYRSQITISSFAAADSRAN